MPDVLIHQQPGSPSPAGLYAPHTAYLTGEEFLRITSFGNTTNVTLSINGRILRPDGTPIPINERHVASSNRAAKSDIFALSEGWLLGVVVTPASGVTAVGACWVALDLVRGSGAAAQLVQSLGFGYVTTRSGFTWPGGVNLLGNDGPGVFRSITGTTPAAGAEISETVPTGARWGLVAFFAQFVTSAAVANRIPVLTIDDGANVYYRLGPINNQTAGTTIRHEWFQGSSAPLLTNSNEIIHPLPIGLRLAAGHRIKTVTTAIDVADQYSAIQYIVTEWIEGQ